MDIDPKVAYWMLGAVATFGIGWARISSSCRALVGVGSRKDFFDQKGLAAKAFAVKIRETLDPNLVGFAHVDDSENIQLIRAIQDLMATYNAPEPHLFDTAKEHFKTVALAMVLLYCYMNVIPAAIHLKPGDPDIPTVLAAQGAIIGIYVGMISCLVYKFIEHKVRT